MAYAPERSRNGSLKNGMTDGTYKKINPDRGGFVERTTELARQALNADTYAYQEYPAKEQPDGTFRRSSGNYYYDNQLRHQG